MLPPCSVFYMSDIFSSDIISVKMVKINIKSVVAGIHRTKVGSHPSIELLVEGDDTIPSIDPNCIVVHMPSRQQLPLRSLSLLNYPKRTEFPKPKFSRGAAGAPPAASMYGCSYRGHSVQRG